MVINNILCKSKEFGGKLTLPKSTPYEIEVTYSAVDRLEPKELNATCTKATLPFAASDVFNAKLLRSESLTSPIGDVKHVYEITLDIKNKVRHHGEEVVDLIDKQCNIYICGDLTSMGKDVVGAVRDCLAVNKQITMEEADAFVKQLQKENRILTDVWI